MKLTNLDRHQVDLARELLTKPDPSGLHEWGRRVGQLEVAVAGLLAIVDRHTAEAGEPQ